MDYSRDGSFLDPVIRCDSCGKMLKTERIRKYGCCSSCGSRKVRNVQVYSEEERDKMVEWDIDPKFLALFEGVPE